MKIQTRPFGVIEVDDGCIISLVEPLAGFPGFVRFAVIHQAETFPLVWLQSLDDSEVCFPMINPMLIKPDYTVDLSPQQRKEVGFSNGALPEVYTLVVVPDDPAHTSTNLRAPLVINAEGRMAKQFILERPDYSIRHGLGGSSASTEGEHTLPGCSN